MPGRLVDRHPTVSPQRLIAQLVPPPTFVDVSFDSYRPDPHEPTQSAAVASCLSFCDEAVRRRAGRRKLFGKREPLPGVGLCLGVLAPARFGRKSEGVRHVR
jgi:cell division protein ZapE